MAELDDSMLEYLSQYTKNKDLDFLRAHVTKIWTEAKEKYHVYGCIERCMFLSPRISAHPFYPTVKEAIDARSEHLQVADIGCAFGTDTRKLIVDGLRPENITSIDITPDYWQLGLKLYMDEDTLPKQIHSRFENVAVPTFNEDKKLSNHFDFAYAGAVLHVLSREDIVAFLTNILHILKPGGTLFGSCVGSSTPQVWKHVPNDTERFRYIHSQETLGEVFKEIGYAHVEVQALLLEQVMRHGRHGREKSLSPIPGYELEGRCYLAFVAKKAL